MSDTKHLVTVTGRSKHAACNPRIKGDDRLVEAIGDVTCMKCAEILIRRQGGDLRRYFEEKGLTFRRQVYRRCPNCPEEPRQPFSVAACPKCGEFYPKLKRGFAVVDKRRQKQIASCGGKAAQRSDKVRRWDIVQAREAGRKGGRATWERRAS